MSQFTSDEGRKNLGDFFKVPPDAYPVGRLDYDSEGLLIITSDKRMNNLLLDPGRQHEREYWVQVEGIPTEAHLRQLCSGVTINLKGRRYQTKKAKAVLFDTPPQVPERHPPIRYRKSVPDRWLCITLTEGKNRQVRRMTAAVGLPTLRLIRARIEGLTTGKMQPGEMIEFNQQDLYNLLRLKMYL